MQRRNFLRLSALGPMACIPFTKVLDLKTVKQTRKSYDERSKYLEYTEDDFMRCKLILIAVEGHRIWSPPITKVTLTKDPFKVYMFIKYGNIKFDLHLKGIQFVDKDRRMLFQPRMFSFPIHPEAGDELNLTYSIVLD